MERVPVKEWGDLDLLEMNFIQIEELKYSRLQTNFERHIPYKKKYRPKKKHQIVKDKRPAV